VRVPGTAVRGVLWCLILLGCPAVALTAALHPAWAPAATVAGIPIVSGSGLGLLLTGARRRQPYPRAAHARPPGLTLRQALWSGIPIAIFMVAIAQSDPVRLRVVDYCGTAMLLCCSGGLILRWWFARHAERAVDRKVYELGQRQAWTDQELGAIRRAVREAFQHAERDVPDAVDEHGKRRRHLRPVRRTASGDTGPQRAVLS
jgi:hypothetical protein